MGMSLPLWRRSCVRGLVTIFRIGGWIRAAPSARPSTIAYFTGPSKCARVPTLRLYVGMPMSEHTTCPLRSAGCALSTMMAIVERPSSPLSRVPAARSASWVSSGTFFSAHSYRSAVTSRICSLRIAMGVLSGQGQAGVARALARQPEHRVEHRHGHRDRRSAFDERAEDGVDLDGAAGFEV